MLSGCGSSARAAANATCRLVGPFGTVARRFFTASSSSALVVTVTHLPSVPGINDFAWSLNAMTCTCVPSAIWVVSQSSVLTTWTHFGDCTCCAGGMLRRRITLTSVRSSMLVDTSTRITTRLPPMRNPVRYCRLPSPTKPRTDVPPGTGSLAAAAKRSFSAWTRASSALSFSTASLRAVESNSAVAASACLAVSSVSRSWRTPRIVAHCSSRCARSCLSVTRFLRPVSTLSSMRFASLVRSLTSFTVFMSMLAFMIMNSRMTAPNPQQIASRNDIEKTLISLRAMRRLHAHDRKLGARRAYPDHVGAPQDRFSGDPFLVDERAEATQVDDAQLAVAQHELAMRARHAARGGFDNDRAAAVGRLAADHQAARVHTIDHAAVDDVGRRGRPGEARRLGRRVRRGIDIRRGRAPA